MAKINFVLDSRPRKDGTTALLLKFIHKRYRKQANLGIWLEPQHWDCESEEITKKHPQHKQYNLKLRYIKGVAENVVLKHIGENIDGEVLFSEIEAVLFPERVARDVEKKEAENTLIAVAKRFTTMKKPSTRATYERTVKHLEAFCGKGNTDNLNEINKAWLAAFDNYLVDSNPSPNARALHFRNLRAVINYAIDEEITTNYPFRRFKIKTVKTAKRNLSVDELRDVFDYEVEEWQVMYRDMFKLSFMLMGINFADLLALTKSQLRGGRIEFNRHKTARLYSMKVEPEAAALIEQYGGVEHLLSIMDSRKDYVQFIRQTNHALKNIGTKSVKGRKPLGEALFPDLSTYWARHSWATIAASLDIPKETIAAALGHGGNTVTDIYIDFDRSKVDAANRKVLDWVLYSKRG